VERTQWGIQIITEEYKCITNDWAQWKRWGTYVTKKYILARFCKTKEKRTVLKSYVII
jgi:hypothetical protein